MPVACLPFMARDHFVFGLWQEILTCCSSCVSTMSCEASPSCSHQYVSNVLMGKAFNIEILERAHPIHHFRK